MKRIMGEEQIQVIAECILATKMPQKPRTLIAQILCDADLFHVSTPNFFYRKLLLRKEWGQEFGKHYSEMEWHQLNFEFLKNHEFQTRYGKLKLQKGQDQNIEKVQNLIHICSEDK